MRNLKRVAWFCFAGCCCAGLMLIGGERSAGSLTYCPYVFYGQFNGSYYYGAFQQGVDCMFPQMYYVSDNRLHDTGTCGTCPDSIVTNSHPKPVELAAPAPAPQPDPMFSGVLR